MNGVNHLINQRTHLYQTSDQIVSLILGEIEVGLDLVGMFHHQWR